jgi:hypothetical protein
MRALYAFSQQRDGWQEKTPYLTSPDNVFFTEEVPNTPAWVLSILGGHTVCSCNPLGGIVFCSVF